jgi:hypothetical protein
LKYISSQFRVIFEYISSQFRVIFAMSKLQG